MREILEIQSYVRGLSGSNYARPWLDNIEKIADGDFKTIREDMNVGRKNDPDCTWGGQAVRNREKPGLRGGLTRGNPVHKGGP